MSLAVGDKVTVTESPWPEHLPNGVHGVVTAEEGGYLLFVDVEGYPADNLSDAYTGWPLTADEVELAEVAA